MLPALAQQQDSGDWPAYGRDPGAQRFSPLTQITPDNVHTLTRAWTFDTGGTAMQVTPLVINGVLFASSGGTRTAPAVLYALDAETGKELWSSLKSIGSTVRGGLSGGQGNVYVPGTDGTLYAFGFAIEK